MSDEPHVTLRDFFDAKFGHLTNQLEAINDNLDKKADAMIARQDKTNGRVQRAEQSIAVLMWAYGVGGAVLAWVVYKLP